MTLLGMKYHCTSKIHISLNKKKTHILKLKVHKIVTI